MDLSEPYADELSAAERAIALADGPLRKMDAVRAGAASLAVPVRHGLVKRVDVRDQLFEQAARSGLVEKLGEAPILMAIEAGLNDFAAATNGHARDDVPLPDGPEDYGLALDYHALVPLSHVPPLVLLNVTEWHGHRAPQMKWLARARIPAGNVSLLSGDGAAGKTTIALQLAVATVLGTDWFGSVIEAPGPVIFFSAEEDQDEIHRRLESILEAQGRSFAELDGNLLAYCGPGQDAVLGAPNRVGIIEPTPLLAQMVIAAENIRPTLIIIEAAADVFAGNENDRSQVRQFIGLLRRLARASGAAVLLIQHPSLSGLSSGSGTSGSTGWNNSVRSRMNFSTVKAREGDDADTSLRELRVKKSNYGPAGEVVRLRWDRGVFVMDGAGTTLDRIAADAAVDDTFLRLLNAAEAQGRPARPHTGRSYAPAMFEDMPGANGITRKAFARAQERLLASGAIIIETMGPPSRCYTVLKRRGVG